MYGLTEKQFRNLFERAKRKKGVTGDVFLTLLETRLDNVVYRLGFAKTRQAARQFVNHGHILVNGIKVDIPSYQVSVGDEIGVREKTSSRQLATRNLEDLNTTRLLLGLRSMPIHCRVRFPVFPNPTSSRKA